MSSVSMTAGGGAAQEAMETAAQTRAEAARGDRQATQKLARSQAPAPAADSDGDHDGSRLNVTA